MTHYSCDSHTLTHALLFPSPIGLVLLPKVSEEVQAASKHFPTLDPCIRKVADDVLIRSVECAKELYSRLGDSRVGATRGILTDREQERYSKTTEHQLAVTTIEPPYVLSPPTSC